MTAGAAETPPRTRPPCTWHVGDIDIDRYSYRYNPRYSDRRVDWTRPSDLHLLTRAPIPRPRHRARHAPTPATVSLWSPHPASCPPPAWWTAWTRPPSPARTRRLLTLQSAWPSPGPVWVRRLSSSLQLGRGWPHSSRNLRQSCQRTSAKFHSALLRHLVESAYLRFHT